MGPPGSGWQQKETPFVENQSPPHGSSVSRTPVHLLKVHVHCVPRHYLFLEGVFLLFLQLFLITSFGHYIPKKLWQRQRCKEGRDKALVRTILDTVFREREFIHIELPIYYHVVTKGKKKLEDTKPNKLWVPALHHRHQLGSLGEFR